MNCSYCNGICIKKGLYKTVQKFKCKSCCKCQRMVYSHKKYGRETDYQIAALNNEGVGISSISRIMSIPKTTVQRRIGKLAAQKPAPVFSEQKQVYEVDELYTYVGRKCEPCYIMYAINKKTKKIINYVCGARNKKNIGRVIQSLMLMSAKRIYTDKLNIYTSLIPANIHRTFQYKTNHIERKNLTLRTHLKRLSRKTICYSKSITMLEACFRLYAWN